MGEYIMAHTIWIVILALFLGGLLGWTLFAVMLNYTKGLRNTELTMIIDIRSEIIAIKSEIRDLKTLTDKY